MWTSRLRRAWMATLPPDKLLPDRQPAYVASWIYVFGVLTLAAFLVILLSGLGLSFAGPAWYHTSSVGRFTNSLHFWSVQLFFIFMVIHLWGKFWMAAWRGRRALTWMTGMVCFLASLGTAFTGYLVQTNFDSQWISFEAKDGLNAVGIGAFFNVANLGQMLLVHACLLPLVVGVVVVWHVLLVRRHGVVPPIDAVVETDRPGRRRDQGRVMTAQRARSADIAAQEWKGPWRRYDILKEGVVAIVVVSILTVLMAGMFGSPDEPQLTIKAWAANAPDNFYATAVQELAGTSESAGYGPPYNTAGTGLSVGPLAPQKWFGVTHPVDPASDFVITPLHSQQQPADVAAALKRWDTAGPDRQTAWATTFDTALTNADDDLNKVPAGDYGPVPTLAKGLTAMAVSGALDGVLMAQGGFYQTDFTKQILFLGDGSYLDDAATAAHLQGNTWGMMNETGSYPGQAWLWLYSFWYQIPQFNSDNPDDYLTSHADAIIFYIMAVLSLGLLLLPFIPGLKSIPRWIPLHRMIWRDYYHQQPISTSGAGGGDSSNESG